jgi:hypothetical protein
LRILGAIPSGVECDPQRIRRRLEQLGGDILGEEADRLIRGDDRPVPVDHERRIRLVCGKEPLQGIAHKSHLRVLERVLRVGGRESAGEKDTIAFAQRQFETLGEMQDHLPARPRPAGLDEAQVPCRDRRAARQL